MRNWGERTRSPKAETIARRHAKCDVTEQDARRVARSCVMESDRALSPRKGRIPRRSFFFHPDRPHASQVLEYVRLYAGWDVASSLETADWCILFQDATWVTLVEDDPHAAVASTWINGRCRDISKR